MTRIGWMLLGMITGLVALAKAEDEPAYINTVGKWEVAGFIKQNGRGSESGLFGLHKARGNRRPARAGFRWKGVVSGRRRAAPGQARWG